MADSPQLKCFLSYSVEQKSAAAAVMSVLETMNVDTFSVENISLGQSITATIIGALRLADFIVVILPDDVFRTTVAFETGLAIGLGKPVLALTRASGVQYELIPGVQVARFGSGDDLSSVLPDIRRFVRHVKPRSQDLRIISVANRDALETARSELVKIRSAHDTKDSGRTFVNIVARFFEQSGLEVLREENDDNRPDLLLWSDPFVSELGGPVIVECKYYGGGTGSVLVNAQHTLRQLANYVTKSSAGIGLLVFDHDRPRQLQLNEYETRKAVAFYVGDLFDAVATGKLMDELWHRRARAIRREELRGDAR